MSRSKETSITHAHRANSRSGLHILFEDGDILVADKPAGLLTMATETQKHRTLYALVADHVRGRGGRARLYIVHRLDRDASGLLVFARSKQAQADLQGQFKAHSAARTYVAVTEHRMAQDTYTLQSYLAENAAYRCYSTPDPAKGKWAVTHVQVLGRSSHRTLVEARLETGRKHQIRVHLDDLGHPVVGDRVYGGPGNHIRRLALHAVRLAFVHPRTRQPMEFCSRAPACFDTLVRARSRDSDAHRPAQGPIPSPLP